MHSSLQVQTAVEQYADVIALRSRRLGREVCIDRNQVWDRSDVLRLSDPGRCSANGSCRMLRAADGWLAINLPRPEDLDLVPALSGAAGDADPWTTVETFVARTRLGEVLERTELLGLSAARVGERPPGSGATVHRTTVDQRPRLPGKLRIVDLSALWAGPLCGAVLAQMGASVLKVESASRPDSTRVATPAFFERLNGAKQRLLLDFSDPEGRAALRAQVTQADVLITSARPRAFAPLGLEVRSVFDANPRLIWVAVTAHGWFGAGANRIGFGDDAAAAGGLVTWTAEGDPHFLGDAVADPLSGLAAAAGALEMIEQAVGGLLDVPMAGVAEACAAGAPAGMRRC